MISTVTTTTVSVVSTVTLAGSLGLVSVVILLSLLIQKELISSASDARARTLGRALNIALVPLLVGFGLLVALRVAQALG
jgi:hypothetical protein